MMMIGGSADITVASHHRLANESRRRAENIGGGI
jgi:hypothetical protein